MIAGLLQPASGQILLDNEPVIGPLDQLMPGHPRIAYLSQQFELPNHYQVHNILSYENRLNPADAVELYRTCRIGHLLQRNTRDLSGGERQRISLARALIKQPRLLLLDEPFSNLDLPHRNTMQAVLDDVMQKYNLSVIHVSHEPEDLLPWADRLMVIGQGGIVQADDPVSLYFRPVNEYAAALLGNYSLLDQHQSGIDTTPGKKLFVRPGHWKLANHGLRVTIIATHFFGHFTEYIGTTDNAKIIFRTTHPGLAMGEIVYVQPNMPEAWFL